MVTDVEKSCCHGEGASCSEEATVRDQAVRGKSKNIVRAGIKLLLLVQANEKRRQHESCLDRGKDGKYLSI